MKTNTQKRPRILIYAAIGLALLVMAGGVAYATGWRPLSTPDTQDTSQESSEINYDEPTQEEIEAGFDAKEQTIQDDQNENNEQSNLSAYISSATQSGNDVVIRTLIEDVVTGNCTLTVTTPSSTFTREATIQALASSSTCQGFTIPTSEGDPGEWDMAISITTPNSSITLNRTLEVE